MSKINPEYYKNNGKDLFTHFYEMFSVSEFRGYLTMNIFKYLYRYKNKNGLEDLNKAKRYLEELITLETRQEEYQKKCLEHSQHVFRG